MSGAPAADERPARTGRPVIAALGGPQAADAVALGIRLARAFDAPLVLARVENARVAAEPETARAAARARLTAAAARVPADIAVEQAPLLDLAIERALHWLASERDAHALVLGAARRAHPGVTGLGRVGSRILGRAPRPVVVAPAAYAERTAVAAGSPIASVGAAVDARPEAREALAFARAVASGADARLRLYSALGAADPDDPAQRARVAGLLGELFAELPSSLDVRGETLDGDAGTAILHAVTREGLGLLVCGSRGYGPVRAVLLGSVSRYVVQRCPCPLAIVPRGAGERGAEAEGERAHHERPHVAG